MKVVSSHLFGVSKILLARVISVERSLLDNLLDNWRRGMAKISLLRRIGRP